MTTPAAVLDREHIIIAREALAPYVGRGIASHALDGIAQAAADAVLEHVDRRGQAMRRPVFDAFGNVHCSWCGRMGCSDGTRPAMLPEHPQYGVFCTCTVPREVEE